MGTFDLDRTRRNLLVNHPFWGSLAYHAKWIEDRNAGTMWTDGSSIHYNPDEMAKRTQLEQEYVMAHELFHIACDHPWRMGNRDPREWNEATDFVVNAALVEAEVGQMPQGCYYDPQYRGMSAEKVYSLRRAQQEPPMQPPEEPEPEEQEPPDSGDEEQDEQGDGSDDSDAGDDSQDQDGQGSESPDAGDDPGSEGDDGPGEGDGAGDSEDGEGDSGDGAGGDGPGELVMPDCPTGEFGPGREEVDKEAGELSRTDWQVIVQEAELVASRAGHLPGGTVQAIEATREPRVDWKAETRDFLTNSLPSSQSWTHPNRRFVHAGLYFPGEVKENVGTLVLAVDTSGSTMHLRREFGSELNGMVRDVRPERLIVIYIDTHVQEVVEFAPDDDVKIEMKGGGGTDFRPAFQYVEDEGLDPLALIYLTDLEGSAPEDAPYPVLWVVPEHCSYDAPFGRLVKIP